MPALDQLWQQIAANPNRLTTAMRQNLAAAGQPAPPVQNIMVPPPPNAPGAPTPPGGAQRQPNTAKPGPATTFPAPPAAKPVAGAAGPGTIKITAEMPAGSPNTASPGGPAKGGGPGPLQLTPAQQAQLRAGVERGDPQAIAIFKEGLLRDPNAMAAFRQQATAPPSGPSKGGHGGGGQSGPLVLTPEQQAQLRAGVERGDPQAIAIFKEGLLRDPNAMAAFRQQATAPPPLSLTPDQWNQLYQAAERNDPIAQAIMNEALNRDPGMIHWLSRMQRTPDQERMAEIEARMGVRRQAHNAYQAQRQDYFDQLSALGAPADRAQLQDQYRQQRRDYYEQLRAMKGAWR